MFDECLKIDYLQDSEKNLPIIICSFSKGCVVLNEICKELLNLKNNKTISDDSDIKDLFEFCKKFKHFIWLDGGHNGTSNAWITQSDIITTLLQRNIYLYVYVTPYQISENNPKKWAIKEHKQFLNLLEKYCSNYQYNNNNNSISNYKANIYYLNNDNLNDYKNYELEAHFKIFYLFDSNLIQNDNNATD